MVNGAYVSERDIIDIPVRTEGEPLPLLEHQPYMVRILGEIRYSGKDGQRFQYQFYETISLQPTYAMYNKVGPPTNYYHALLRPESTPYTLTIPIAQVVQAGDTDWFGIELAVPRTSHHQFTIEMRYNEGISLFSPQIHLGMIVPHQGNPSQKNTMAQLSDIAPLEVWQ
jgi:hypothetical protein